MNNERLEALAPWSGVLAVIVTIVGVILGGDIPAFLAGGDEIATYLVEDNGAAQASALLWMLATVPLAWFVGVVWSRLRSMEGDLAARLAATGAVGGAIGVATWLGGASIAAVAALRADEDGAIDAVAATVYADLGNIAWGAAAPIGFGILLLAVGVAALRTGGPVPRWLGWVSVVFAVWAFIPPISWAFAMAGWNLWLLVTAVWLARHPKVTAAGS